MQPTPLPTSKCGFDPEVGEKKTSVRPKRGRCGFPPAGCPSRSRPRRVSSDGSASAGAHLPPPSRDSLLLRCYFASWYFQLSRSLGLSRCWSSAFHTRRAERLCHACWLPRARTVPSTMEVLTNVGYPQEGRRERWANECAPGEAGESEPPEGQGVRAERGRWRESATGRLLAFPEWYESRGRDVSREGAGPYLGVAGTLYCRVGTARRGPRPSSKRSRRRSAQQPG